MFSVRKSQILLSALVAISSIAVAFSSSAKEPIDDGSIDTPRWTQSTEDEGIWKALTPPGSMKGEFDSHDPIGLAAGALIKADCSINWVNPDNGKLFCFSSGTSLVYFLRWPAKNAARAKKGWRRLTAPTN